MSSKIETYKNSFREHKKFLYPKKLFEYNR